jgi:hypothetical protein
MGIVMGKPVVFLGPTLPIATARAVCDATYLPPVCQGDILRAAQSRPPAIAIIDGIFANAPTIRHREILWVLSQGIPIFGAASMGALRAAELADHGMIGHGVIYRWYRRFPMAPDDAVAITHAPREIGSAPLSDAMVDIRQSLKTAHRSGRITDAQYAHYVQKSKKSHFSNRQLKTLSTDVDLTMSRVSQKSLDAIGLLKTFAVLAKSAAWPVPETPRPAVIDAWVDDLRASGIDPTPYLPVNISKKS